MDYVNCQVAIGGDQGNTVPKFFVPVSEIPVLLAIHGPDSLTEFEQIDAPEDRDDLSNTEELERLHSIYGSVKDGSGDSVLRKVYPGVGAKVATSIDALDLPEGAFKVLERAKPKAATKKSKKADKPAEGDDASIMD